MSSAINRPTAANERTQFAQASSFATPMIFAFLAPEQRAAMAGVNRAYAKAAWKPTLSPMANVQAGSKQASSFELAHYREALGNRRLTNLSKARQQYILGRKFERLNEALTCSTFFREKGSAETGVEVVKISSLEQGNFWTRITMKIRFYSGYEHILAQRGIVQKLNAFKQTAVQRQIGGEGLIKQRDARVTVRINTDLINAGVKSAIQKNELFLKQETNNLNWLVRVIAKIAQKIVGYFLQPYVISTPHSTWALRGSAIGRMDENKPPLEVHTTEDFLARPGAVRFTLLRDGFIPLVSCMIQRVWTDETGNVIHEGNVSLQHRRKLRDRRLLVTEINAVSAMEKSGNACGEAMAKNPVVMEAITRGLLENERFIQGLANKIKETLTRPPGIAMLFSQRERLPSCLAASLFSLIAGIFDSVSEQHLELSLLDPRTNTTQILRIRKDEDRQVPLGDINSSVVRWGLLRDNARNLPIFRDKQFTLPSFFRIDLSQFAAPAPDRVPSL